MVVLCEIDPLVPVRVMRYVPVVPVQVNVDVAELVRDTLAGLRLQVRPVNGDTLAARPTVPENPARLLRLIVMTAFVPGIATVETGLDPSAKSAG